MRHPLLLVAIPLLAACSSDRLVSTYGSPNRTLTVAVGQQLDVTLQTVGPGEYATPPTVSSAALSFLGDSLVGPPIPAGPTQLFRFRAEQAGRAVLTFRHTGNDPTVVDTVLVR